MKEKTMREQDAFRFAREMVALYFGKRDIAALPSPTALWSLPPVGDRRIVYGTLTAVPSDLSLSDEHLRLSVVQEQAEDGLKLVAYVDELGDYQRNFDTHSIFYCRDIESLHPDVYAVLKPQGIRSMLQCAMLDEGMFVGYVGFHECRENRRWNERQVAAFKLTADVLSTFLLKLRQNQKKQWEEMK